MTQQLITSIQNHPKTLQLVNSISKQNIKCVLTRNIKLPLNPLIKIPQYLKKDALPYTIFVIYLEIDLLEKFNLNLGYILTGVLNLNNQDDTLYKAFVNKLIDTLLCNNFITIESGDKLWGLIPGS